MVRPNFGQTAEGNQAGPLLEAVMNAERANRELFDSLHLAETVDHLCAHARALDNSRLWGASEVGNRLIGAMLLTNPKLRLWTPGEAAQVVLIDGFVAAPTGVVSVASNARSLGASSVTAVVLGLGADQLPGVPWVDAIRQTRTDIGQRRPGCCGARLPGGRPGERGK